MVTFKFGMSLSRTLGTDLRLKIDEKLLDVTKTKSYEKRVSDFFNQENIDGCIKDSMKSRDNYKIVDMKELGYLYFGVVVIGIVFSVSIFVYLKYRGQAIDKGQKELDLREVKNKEITQGVSMLFSLYLKANETKIMDYSLKNFDEFKKRKFEMLINKFKGNIFIREEDGNIYNDIFKADRDLFYKYTNEEISLLEMVGVAGGRRKSSPRNKIFPENSGKRNSSRLFTPRNRLSSILPNLLFKTPDVPSHTKENIRDYIQDKHNKSVLSSSSWFSLQASRFLRSFNGRNLSNYASTLIRRTLKKTKTEASNTSL